jgi:hypothetical protein
MGDEGRPKVTQENGVWVVRVERGGHQQEYRCATEAQARALEMTLIEQHRAEEQRRR